jgi:hypothetical protein
VLLLGIFDIAATDRADFERALSLEFADFEDAVQAACAARVKADYLVTRDVKGFRRSPVPPASAGAVFAALDVRDP